MAAALVADAPGRRVRRAERKNATPKISPWLVAWFGNYAERYVRGHFHAVRVSLAGSPPPCGAEAGPLVVFGNHSSWWDPLIGLILARRFFPGRALFAPMDARALARYKFLARVGFFGVELESPRGGADFLRASAELLARPGAMLWLTPQGRFADARERPARFKPGISHLAARAGGITFLPVAAEYLFWQERTPEVCVRFGEPVKSGSDRRDAAEWTRALERALEGTQEALAREAALRDPALFSTILAGRAGIGGVYDAWRKMRARLRGEKFHAEHAP